MKYVFILCISLLLATKATAQTPIVTINANPSGAICAGTTVNFSASVQNPGSNPSYQWFKNGTAIANETNSTYVTSTLANNDQIRVSYTYTSTTITSGTNLKFNYDAANSTSYSGNVGTLLTWNDLSGNSTHATFLTTPTFISTSPKSFEYTRGAHWQETSKRATLTNVLGDDMTVAAWIKTSTVGYSTPHYQLMYILSSEASGGANDWGFGINNSGKLAFGNGPNDATIASTDAVNTGNWVYVAATRKKSNGEIKLYINGASNGSGTSNANNTLNAVNTIAIADGNDGTAYSFGGNIAAVQGYNSVLTAAEILTNYNARVGTTITSSNITTTVNALPSVTISIAGDQCANKTNLSATVGNSYAWFLNGSEISGANTQTYTPPAAGSYTVRVFNGTCNGTSSGTTINTCGITATGRMSTSASLVNKLGGAANTTNKGVDDRGLVLNIP